VHVKKPTVPSLFFPAKYIVSDIEIALKPPFKKLLLVEVPPVHALPL
jgi:hypothetical protein